MKKLFIILLVSVFALCAYAEKKPNILFILIDDMGVSDIGAFGAEFYETPIIDSLADEGIKFNNAYTSLAICAPARASAMTGKSPLNLGMWNHLHFMPEGSETLAQNLKNAGYKTWHIGKWHCGGPDNNTLPQNVGFDINIAGCEAFAPASYFWPYRKNKNIPIEKVPVRLRVPDLEEGGKEGEYLTDRVTDEAIKLINNHDGKSPFFLNLWHFAVHEPLGAKADKIEKYRQKAQKYYADNLVYDFDARGTKYTVNPNLPAGPPINPKTGKASPNNLNTCYIYAAMIESLDENIGRLMQALKDKGYYDNTLIVFYSDNGPLTNCALRTPYRGGKNSTYEGGVREPAFIVWKGKVLPKSVSDAQVNIFDLPYTMLEAAGTSFSNEHEGDGKSLLPLITGKDDKFENRDFFWYFPSTRMHWGQYASMGYKDKDNFKYVMMFNGEPDELYDLNKDPLESNNIAELNPERAKKMEEIVRKKLAKHYKDMPLPDEIYIENVELRLEGKPAKRVGDRNY